MARAAIPAYHEYQPYENLNSWRIPSYPDLVLMEGRKVKLQDNGGRFWQPFLVLYSLEAVVETTRKAFAELMVD